MRKIIPVILVVALLLAACQKNSDNANTNNSNQEGKFIYNLIQIIPEPDKDEFSDYKMLINTFFNSLNDNNYDLGLKCFPINEEYKAMDIDTFFKRMQIYRLEADTPLPTDQPHNYFVIFSKYESYWQKYYLNLLFDSNPGLEKIEITDDNANWKTELEKVKAMKVTKKYSTPKIEDDIVTDPDDLDKAMNVSEKRVITLSTYIDNEKDNELNLTITIDKINGNWRIKNI